MVCCYLCQNQASQDEKICDSAVVEAAAMELYHPTDAARYFDYGDDAAGADVQRIPDGTQCAGYSDRPELSSTGQQRRGRGSYFPFWQRFGIADVGSFGDAVTGADCPKRDLCGQPGRDCGAD